MLTNMDKPRRPEDLKAIKQKSKEQLIEKLYAKLDTTPPSQDTVDWLFDSLQNNMFINTTALSQQRLDNLISTATMALSDPRAKEIVTVVGLSRPFNETLEKRIIAMKKAAELSLQKK